MDNLNLAFTLLKAQYSIAKKFDKLAHHGLGLSEFMMLYALYNSLGMRCRRVDLAEMMGMTASGITRLLAPMEKMGLVERQVNTRDARVSFVVITEAGERIFLEAKITAQEIAKEVFAPVKKKNIEALMDILLDLNIKFS